MMCAAANRIIFPYFYIVLHSRVEVSRKKFFLYYILQSNFFRMPLSKLSNKIQFRSLECVKIFPPKYKLARRHKMFFYSQAAAA